MHIGWYFLDAVINRPIVYFQFIKEKFNRNQMSVCCGTNPYILKTEGKPTRDISNTETRILRVKQLEAENQKLKVALRHRLVLANNNVWLRKDLEQMSYEQLLALMLEWDENDVCTQYTWWHRESLGTKPPESIRVKPIYFEEKMTESEKMVRMMNWLLGRQKVIPQSLKDDRLDFQEDVSWEKGEAKGRSYRHHGARLLEKPYLDYFEKMHNARKQFEFDRQKK